MKDRVILRSPMRTPDVEKVGVNPVLDFSKTTRQGKIIFQWSDINFVDLGVVDGYQIAGFKVPYACVLRWIRFGYQVKDTATGLYYTTANFKCFFTSDQENLVSQALDNFLFLTATPDTQSVFFTSDSFSGSNECICDLELAPGVDYAFGADLMHTFLTTDVANIYGSICLEKIK